MKLWLYEFSLFQEVSVCLTGDIGHTLNKDDFIDAFKLIGNIIYGHNIVHFCLYSIVDMLDTKKGSNKKTKNENH